MVKVALAGCAGGFGMNILEAFLEEKKHDVILLTRSPKPHLAERNVDVRVVNYTDHVSLVNALQDVDTVICTISVTDPDCARSHIALLEAGKEAGIKRFAPSEFAITTNKAVSLFAPKEVVWKACLESGLDCTRFVCGIFTNSMGYGTTKNPQEALGGYNTTRNYIVDIPAGIANIPGDGNDPLVFTTTKDVGRFVAASVDLEHWHKESLGMVGERLTYNQVTDIAEKVTGRKIVRKYTPVEDMRRLHENESNLFMRGYWEVSIGLTEGIWDPEPDLNRLCPQVKPMGVEEFFKKYWEGVEFPDVA